MTVQHIWQQLHITQTLKIIASTRLIAPLADCTTGLHNQSIRLKVRHETTRKIRHRHCRLIRHLTQRIGNRVRKTVP